MARTAIDGSTKMVSAANAVDTNGYGKVTFVVIASAASASAVLQDGDTTSTANAAAEDLIDPTTGQPATLTGLANGSVTLISYIGDKRYVKAGTGTNTTVYALLEEPRRTN